MSNAKVSAAARRTALALYVADRSPTGHAVAGLALLDTDGVRRCEGREVAATTALYATPEAAKAAARRRWTCVA